MILRRSGQSLVEVLVAVAIGAILITAGVMLIIPAIRANSNAAKVQVAASYAKGLLDNVQVWSQGNWNNVLALATGTSYHYYLNTSSSPFTAATGTQSLVIVSGTSTVSSLSTGLIGAWPVNEGSGSSTIDASGNGNNGTWYGTPAGTSGYYGAGYNQSYAGYFDGSTDYVQSPNLPSINTSTQAFSVAISFRITAPGVVVDETGQTALNGAWHDSWIEVMPGNNVGIRVSQCSPVTIGNINTSSWHQVVLIYNPPNLSGYLDGVFGGSENCTRSTPGAGGAAGEYINLGPGDATNMGSGAWFSGEMQNFYLYNRSLSAAEVAQLYALGQSTVTYSRYFSLSDVERDSGGNIVTSGGTYDPSTKLLTVTYQWVGGPVSTMATYLVRANDRVVSQANWSGGPGFSGAETSTNDQFATSTNIDYATPTGSLYLAIPGY